MDKLVDSHIPLDFWFENFFFCCGGVFLFYFLCTLTLEGLSPLSLFPLSLSCLCAQGAVDGAAPLSGTDGSLADKPLLCRAPAWVYHFLHARLENNPLGFVCRTAGISQLELLRWLFPL